MQLICYFVMLCIGITYWINDSIRLQKYEYLSNSKRFLYKYFKLLQIIGSGRLFSDRLFSHIAQVEGVHVVASQAGYFGMGEMENLVVIEHDDGSVVHQD